MTDADEILEIGEDGTFDIPLKPVVVKHTPVFVAPSHAEPDNNVSEPEANTNFFLQLVSGEYKIVRENDRNINVVICIEKGVAAEKFRLNSNLLVVDLSDGRKMKIDIPVEVSPTSATAKSFGEYVVVKMELKK